MEKKTNLVFIFADQYRASALSGIDPNVVSPNLCRMMKNGTRMENCLTSDPVCTPARGSILTGLMPYNHGAVKNNLFIRTDINTIAKEFKNNGYETGYIGKLHLDGDSKPGFVPKGPRRLGFDYWAAFNRGHFYWNPTYFTDTDTPICAKGYEPDIQTDLAIDYIKKNKEVPFMLVMSWGPPHTPLFPGKDENTYGFSPFDEEKIVIPDSVPSEEVETTKHQLSGYYEHIRLLDQNIGRIQAAIEENGLSENTIFVFTADHGDVIGEHGKYRKNIPIRECMQIPFIITGPGVIPEGKVCKEPFSSIDFMPTLLSLCGVHLSSAIDGKDKSDCILNTSVNKEDYVCSIIRSHKEGEMGSTRTVYDGQYALTVHRENPKVVFQLYDWVHDPLELNNLAGDDQYTEIESKLLRKLNEFMKTTNDTDIL